MKTFKLLIFFVIVIFLRYTNLRAETEQNKEKLQKRITLEEAIELTLKNNFDIRESFINEKNANIEKKVKLLNSLIPSITASAETANNWKKSDITDSNSEVKQTPEAFIKGKLKWEIMSIPIKVAKYKITKQKSKFLKAIRFEIIEKKIEDTIDKYYNVVINQEKYKVLKKSLDLSKEKLDIFKKKFKTGQVAKSDLLQSQIEYNESNSRLIEQEQNLILARFELYKVLGINEEIEIFENIPHTKEMSWDQIINNFNKFNKTIKVLKEKTLLVKSKDEKNGMKLFMPNLFTFIELDILKNRQYEKNEWSSPVSNINLGMGIKFDLSKIIKGIATKRVSNAEFKIKKLKESIEIERLKVLLKNNYNIYKYYIEMIKLGKKNLDSTKKNLQMQIKKFNNGNIKLLELHIAMHKEREANLTLLNNIYFAKKYETILKQMTGMLSQIYLKKS